MKKAILGVLLSLFAAMVLAMPSPRQIEDALAGKDYSNAKSMIQEVLRERPDSARAHLLYAYLLIHVDHNKTAANAELETASGLDKKGDVKGSPLFGRVVTEIEMQPAVMTGTIQARPMTAAPRAGNGENFGEIVVGLLLVLGFIALLVYLISRIGRTEHVFYTGTTGGGSAGRCSYDPYPSAPSGSGGAYYPQAVAPVVVAQTSQPMGAFGTAASVAGGVVAGNVLSDALLNRHRAYDEDEEELHRRRRRRRDEEETSYPAQSFQSDPTPSPVSYESERSSFSSGGSDSWSSSDSGSSFDSGSSSDF